MAEKITRNYKVSAQGLMSIDGSSITISVEDRGEFDLAVLLSDFNDKCVKLSVAYDEDYSSPDVDESTGEII